MDEQYLVVHNHTLDYMPAADVGSFHFTDNKMTEPGSLTR